MKITLASILLLVSTAAYGDGYGGAVGENKLGQIIHIAQEGMSYRIYVQQNKSDNEWNESYGSKEDWPIWISNHEGVQIVFNPDGKSPLAGVTYKIMTSKKIVNGCGDPATIYQCSKGCENNKVPQIFIEEPWEC